MATDAGASIATNFGDLKDSRIERSQGHQLLDILVIAIFAMICGANDWEAVPHYGRSKEAWFRTFLTLPNGIPTHATFWRVFRALDPEQFERCSMNWIQAVSATLAKRAEAKQVVAIDGKTLRRSHDKGTVTPPFTWSAPGPVPTGSCWGSAR